MPTTKLKQLITTGGASFLGKISTGALIIITIPWIRETLDHELFGFWMMLGSLISFMSFADFGVGNAILNEITKTKALDNKDLLTKCIIAGYGISLIVAAVLLGLWILWVTISDNPVTIIGAVQNKHQQEVFKALNAFVILFTLNIPASLIQKIQLGTHQGHWNGFIQFAGSSATLILFYLIIKSGNSSVLSFIYASLGVVVVINFINTISWLSRNNHLHFKTITTTVDKKICSLILNNGKMFFVLQVTAALAFQSDAIIITQTMGNKVYGDFAVIQKIFMMISIFLNIAMIGLWPAFGDALAKNNIEWIFKTMTRAMLLVGTLALILVSIVGFATPAIIRIWLKQELEISISLIIGLGLWTIIEALANIPGAIMNSANILRPQIFIALIMGISAFGLKWILVKDIGISGAIWATIIAYVTISVPAQFFILKQFFHQYRQHTSSKG